MSPSRSTSRAATGRAYMMLVMACVSTVAVAAAPRSAKAQRLSAIGYASSGAPSDGAAAAAAVLAAAVGDGATAVVAPFQRAAAALSSGAVAASRLELFRRARQLEREGWRAYLAVEAAFAASRLAEARRVAARLLDLQGGLQLYADLSLRLGVVLLHLARPTEADVLFRLTRRLTPQRSVSLALFAPAVVKAYAATAAPVATKTLTLVASVPGAALEVDGRDLGTSPRRVTLDLGQHVVVARAPGYRTATVAFAVEPRGNAVAVHLDRDQRASAVHRGVGALAVGTTELHALHAVEGLITYGDTDGVLLVASVWRRRRPALLGQLCRGVPARCGPVMEIGYPASTPLRTPARALWQALTEPGQSARFPPTLLGDARLRHGEARPGAGPVDRPPRQAWWKNRWLWAGVGAASITAGAAWLLRGDTETRPLIGIDPCAFGGC